MTQRSITEPNYFRAGVNNSGSDIAPKFFVSQDTEEDEITLSTAATDPILGVSVETIYDGKSQSYQVQGRCPITAGAAVDIGDLVTSDGSGRAITAAVAGNVIKGRACTAAGVAGDVIDIELFPGVAFVPA